MINDASLFKKNNTSKKHSGNLDELLQLQHLTKLVKSHFVQQMEYFLTDLRLYVLV